MRIAYLLYDFDMGGMVSWVYRLATRLADRHELHFVCTHVPRIAPRFSDVGRAHYVGRDWGALQRYLRRHRIDVVQYGQHRVFGDCAMAARVPVVIERTDGARDGALEHSKRSLDAVVASTRGTVPRLAELVDPSRIHLIYNGVDVEHHRSVSPNRLDYADDDILIGRVSRLGRGKNIELLIDAVRQLNDRHPQIRLIIVGGSSRMPGATDGERALRAHATGLESWVRFVGQVDQPDSLIAGFDIGACVSRQGNEGIPNSLLECMAAGKPVVATDVDDIAELIVEDENGLLVHDNDLTSLVQALERLIQHPALRQRLGQRAQQRITRDFDLDIQAKKYEDLYDTLLGRVAQHSALQRTQRALRSRIALTVGAAQTGLAQLRKAASYDEE